MSITDTNKIDIVATRPDSSIVKLVITDHLDWRDFDTHAQLLQDKINTYLQFVESGQLASMEDPKVPESPEICISLAMQHRPSKEAERFLLQVRTFLQGVGLALEIDYRPPGN